MILSQIYTSHFVLGARAHVTRRLPHRASVKTQWGQVRDCGDDPEGAMRSTYDSPYLLRNLATIGALIDI